MTNIENGHPAASKTIVVSKQDAEGVLVINALTGAVEPGQHDRPEWAESLVLAQLAERHGFYNSRLGTRYSDEMRSPEVLAFEDVAWLHWITDETSELGGHEFATEADAEHRMNIVATVLGIERSADADTLIASGDLSVELEMGADNHRSDAEMRSLAAAQEEGFEAVNADHDAGRKTGTHN